jgi:hypothetical protein
MAITFKGQAIRGSHGSLIFTSPDPQLKRSRYFDIKGEAEIAGESGGRPITIDHLLHFNCSNLGQLQTLLDKLDKLVGQHGLLRHETGSGASRQLQRFDDCTFEGYEFRALAGQQAPGPLQDVAGTLFDDDGNADEGWFAPLTLKFRQLLV